MLELFRKSRNHLALVLDADEKMLGLVSFEDVLEELVGDIRDEFDIERGPFSSAARKAVLVDADLPLRDLASENRLAAAHADHRDGGKRALRLWGHVPHTGTRWRSMAFSLLPPKSTLRAFAVCACPQARAATGGPRRRERRIHPYEIS